MKRATFLVGAGLVSTTAFAADVNLGPADIIAVDQPRVVFQLTMPGTDDIVGPNLDNIGLLDTGANGLLLSKGAFDQETNPQLPYQPALNSDGQEVVYYESGVSGFEALTVYRPYDIQFSGLTGTPVQIVQNVNVFGSPFIDLGVSAVIGMPTMAGRVIQMDPKPLTYGAGFDFLQTQFYTAPPVSTTAVSYNIPLPMLDYVHSGVDPDHPNDPRPTFADLPLVDLSTTAHGITVPQRLLLDTGAQVSIISMTAAQAMGMVMTDEAEGGDILDYLTVGGIGGEVEMPIVQIDKLIVPTMEGDDLVFTNLQLGVLEIVGIDGVLGMNLLTTGYLDHLGMGDGQYGAFSEITLDFRNSEEGMMRLDVNPAYLVPEPTSLAAIGVLSMLLARRRPR